MKFLCKLLDIKPSRCGISYCPSDFFQVNPSCVFMVILAVDTVISPNVLKKYNGSKERCEEGEIVIGQNRIFLFRNRQDLLENRNGERVTTGGHPKHVKRKCQHVFLQ